MKTVIGMYKDSFSAESNERNNAVDLQKYAGMHRWSSHLPFVDVRICDLTKIYASRFIFEICAHCGFMAMTGSHLVISDTYPKQKWNVNSHSILTLCSPSTHLIRCALQVSTMWALQKGNREQNSWVSDVYWVSTRWALGEYSQIPLSCAP